MTKNMHYMTNEMMMMKMMAIVLKAIYAEKLEAEGWGRDGVGVLRL